MKKNAAFRPAIAALLALALSLAGCGKNDTNPNLASIKIEQLTIKPMPSEQEIANTAGQARIVLDSLKSGADFESLARRWSTHSSASRGGLITLTPGWMPAGFDDSVMALPDGGMSGLILTPVAVYIVRRDSSEYLSVRSSHILIPPDTSRIWVTREQAWKEAEATAWDLYRRAKAGESFYDLAQKYSKDPGSAKNGGDIGWTQRNRLVKEYEDVAFRQAEGEISKPVKTIYGWHVIRTVKKKDLNLFLHLIEFKVPVDNQDLARARKVADEARSQAQSGKPLEQLSKELAGGPDAGISYSQPYDVRRKMLLPQIAKVVDKMDEGDVSTILEVDNSYYFLKLIEK